MFDKFKKEVGFIKNHSSRKELAVGKEESDDSFSSFEYQPYRHEEFSPYKHPHLQKQHKEEKTQKNQMQPQFSNLRLRNNFEPKQEKSKNLKEQKERKLAINDDSEEQTPKLQSASSNTNQQEELSLSNINQFQKGKSSKVTPAEEKPHKTIAQYQKYLEQSDSSSSEEEAASYKKTVKSKPLQITKKQELEEELITEWDKRQFKDKRIKTAIKNQQRQHQPINGICEAKGGMCFELDKKQFKSRPKQQKKPPTYQKRRDVNSREEIIKRKQKALIFDRKSRVKIFGYS